jgi:hypothetical protein
MVPWQLQSWNGCSRPLSTAESRSRGPRPRERRRTEGRWVHRWFIVKDSSNHSGIRPGRSVRRLARDSSHRGQPRVTQHVVPWFNGGRPRGTSSRIEAVGGPFRARSRRGEGAPRVGRGRLRGGEAAANPVTNPAVRGRRGYPVAYEPVVTWLILPVVICLSQRLSHACLSISNCTAKLRMAH